MAPEVSARHPLSRVTRLLFSRGMHLMLGVVALGFCVFAGIDASKVRPNDGTLWLLGRPELIILDVPPRLGAPASPLQPGDRIVGIGNKLVRSPQNAASLLSQQKVGASVDYLIEREGEMRVETVLLTPFRAVGHTYLYHVLLAAAYTLIGFLVYLRSRNDQPARLFFLLCLTFAVFFITNQNRSSYFWGDIITQNGGALARFLLPALFLHFFLVFPEKKLILTRHPFLEPLLYLLPGMFYVRFALDQFFGERGASIGTTDWLILGLYFASGLVALLHSYFSYRDPLQKERVRILTIGTLTGVLPFLLFKVGLESITSNEVLGIVGQVPLLAIPVSFGYCIARYRVMQIELLIKRSLVYTLLTAGVLLIYLSLVLVLGGLILRLSGPTSQLVSVGATLIIAAALWPARARIQSAVDRKFFRARDDMTSVLQAISREIPRLIQRDALLERVGQRLRETLDIPRLAIYLRTLRAGQPRWTLASSSLRNPGGLRHEEIVSAFPEELFLDAIVRIIARRNEPFWTEPPRKVRQDPHLAITREQAELAQRLQEQDGLASAGIALLVPLATQGRLIGLIALPFKLGDEAYRLPELELLTLVAGQLALQVENARLYEEEVAKQKLEEEMAMARTIQSRLLPNRIPHVPGAELQAVNISSRQVSGDYYDLIEREDGWLGLIISDVSGKGMPASLLASSLQAAMRAQCDTGAPPSTVMARVNRQLHASTDPQHFATLFLAFYHPGKHILCYSCGGHNAPILLRRDGSVDLLEKGGLPLGAFDFGEYEEDTVHLEQGDLLFMYTDGLTETKNSDDEDFGTDRLEAFLRENRDRSAEQILTRVHQAVKDFCGREEADDDITLIALKITGRGSPEEGELT
jgi:sigma-B regulation protein RsbU (phosphoserine phosphatase)